MRKTFSSLLMLFVCISFLSPIMKASGPAASNPALVPAIASNNTIVVSNSTDVPDAHVVQLAVYKIAGSNYFRLRDLAMILKGSEKQFSVSYEERTKTVSLTSGKEYTATGSELRGTASENASAAISNNEIYINGESVTLTVYKIEGSNYFKLRDLGEALDFYVGYDDRTKTVYISGAKGYEKDPGPSETRQPMIPYEQQAVH